jgi:hypothetical protein
VERGVRPHLEAILAGSLEAVAPYLGLFKGFLDRVEEFGTLPLWVAHYDLNEVNVLIDEDCEVTGVIDWELSAPKPFGVGFGRIHTLAGEYTGGEFWMPEECEVAESAFWGEMFAGMPPEVRKGLEEKMDLVQDAVILGTLLDCAKHLGHKRDRNQERRLEAVREIGFRTTTLYQAIRRCSQTQVFGASSSRSCYPRPDA